MADLIALAAEIRSQGTTWGRETGSELFRLIVEHEQLRKAAMEAEILMDRIEVTNLDPYGKQVHDDLRAALKKGSTK